ncbi:MAG: FliI/YscN family ATPase [Armatimonadia bacterium]
MSGEATTVTSPHCPLVTREKQWLEDLAAQVRRTRRHDAVGRVVELVGLTVVSEGPPAGVGEICKIQTHDGHGETAAQVVGFRRGMTLLLPLGRLSGVEPGCQVVARGTSLTVQVGDGALGRVLDAFGQPIDGLGGLGPTVLRAAEALPPSPLTRQRVLEPMFFGVRALDGLLTCGRGQRLGIFSGAGAGKSTLLGMMARHSQADVTVVALIGERGREVRDFLEGKLREGRGKAVVVVATSDEPALVRITAGLTATAIAEYFRDQGLNVLLLMDSLTRLARAQREVGLAAGETPTTRGFPPSMYEFLPRLLERAGAADRGTITGVYSVLVEGDDLSEPVADTVSAILDGHIVLSRQLADQGHYPAIDMGGSISRLMPQVVGERHRQAAGTVRALVGARREVEDLLAVGAYRAGARPHVDRALRLWERLQDFLRQSEDEYTDPAETQQRLLQLAEAE